MMRVIAVIYFLLFTLTAFGQARRAENLIEKEKYETAYEVLFNGMEKDSTDAALPFVLASLYLNDSFPNANLDSAYYYSVLSIAKYDRLDEKNLDKHIKDGFGKTRLVDLKLRIDHLAFERAKSGGKEESYQQFIDQHSDAAELDSAIFLRNEQAFLKASQVNTRSGYKYFIDNYPGSNDWQEADARYQRILYRELTSSGKLKEYLSFIHNYPNSPYFEEAVSKIYVIEVGENTTEALLDFVDNYPNTQAAQKAISLLYYQHIASEPAESFADKYPRIKISDSLKKVIAFQSVTLLPTARDSFIQFIDLDQHIKIDSLDSIEKLPLDFDFISAEKKGTHILLNKLGQVFYKGNWQQSANMGAGFIALKRNNTTRVVHMNGDSFETGENPYLAGPFIAYHENSKWGLISITGKNIAAARFDSIWYDRGLIFLKQGEKISPNLPSVFYPALDGESYSSGVFYEEYEWLNDTLLWVDGNNKEGLFNNHLEPLVPYQKQQIDLAGRGYTISRKGKVKNPVFSDLEFLQFDENEHWQIGSGKDTLIVKYNYQTIFQPDSAFLLGPASIEMRWGDSTFVYLTDTIRLFKPVDEKALPILDQANNAAYYEFAKKKKSIIFNREGIPLDLPKYSEFSALNDSYFLLKEGKHYSLYTSSVDLLQEDLQGAALLNDSTISILQDQKFGVLRLYDSLYIDPKYEKKPLLLIDSLWVISIDGMEGIISSSNNEIVVPIYESIQYWTNGLVFLKKDLKWLLYDLKTNRFIDTGILKYNSLVGSSIPTITYQKGIGTGIIDAESGIILRPTYTSIQRKGTISQPYYLADKYVEEASLHVLLYYDMTGKLLFKKVLSDEQFEAVYGKVE